MAGANNIEVRVENLLARFTPTPRVDLEEAVERLGGVVNGDVIIKMLDRPRATLIIDSEGRIVVHGTHRIEAARAAAKELLLRLGLDESGLQTELGPVIASFNFESGVNVEAMNKEFTGGSATYDQRLGCAVIQDNRHNLKLYVWPNGKCVASDARHPNMVAMSAVFWKNQLQENNLLL